MRFQLIDTAKKEVPVQRLCKVLGVSESGYFAWKGRPACRRRREDMVLLAHVRSAFALSNGTYGSLRMTHELRDHGLQVGRRPTARLMRDNGLKARQKRRFKRTTDSEHAWPIAPNLIDQDFAATAPNQKWGVDISYVWTRKGWLYLAVVIDLFSRRVVGWSVGDRLHRSLALAASRRALAIRRPAPGLIHHSDRDAAAGFKRSSQQGLVGAVEPLVKRLCRRLPAPGLPGSGVEGGGHRRDLLGAVFAQVRAFREVLPQQAVGVLVRAALPRTARITEVDLDARVDLQASMLGHLCALVAGQRSPELLGQGENRARNGGADRLRAMPGERGAVLQARPLAMSLEAVKMQKLGEAGGAFDERTDRRAAQAQDQISFPMARDLSPPP